ncbi:hypothetical protein [Propionispora hippei]|uniref:Uncharacterized protein n=1 Tax=Propionispora hippei DSM 15287 TaxID=1123003 RepID=A0A1M6CVD7_9FIRM|nr:hypothetical protein [Propionispora hippei]SHI64919.1 hypothetical protein SAMN02745170_00752 [Propionispora hippei DSM 15287]
MDIRGIHEAFIFVLNSKPPGKTVFFTRHIRGIASKTACCKKGVSMNRSGSLIPLRICQAKYCKHPAPENIKLAFVL